MLRVTPASGGSSRPERAKELKGYTSGMGVWIMRGVQSRMGSHLGHGRDLDGSGVLVTPAELPPLPDAALRDRQAGYVDMRAWFSNPDRPLELEIGSGKGTFLLQQAEVERETNFVGVEWEYGYCVYAADRIRRAGLDNVRMVATNGVELLRWRVPDRGLRVIHLYFSDPWPKTRHHKNRVVQDGFLGEAWRTLIPGGELRIVTDHADYWRWMEGHFERWAGAGVEVAEERRRFDRAEFAPFGNGGEGELVGTNFERKYRRERRPFFSTTLRRPG